MILTSERIFLRPLEESDAELFLANTMDEQLRYMTGTKVDFTLEEIIQHIKRVSEDSSRYDFAICLGDTNEMIGELAITHIDREDNKAGFRISMCSMELTGKGYGTEAIQMVLNFVFEDLQLNRLQLEVFSHNTRGLRAYEKVGFVREGVLRKSLYFNGTYSDEIIMSMLKSDYYKLRY